MQREATSPTPGVLVAIFLLLLLGLGGAVGAYYIPMATWRLVASLAFAGAKMLLIILYFMRLRYQRSNLPLFVVVGFIWLAVMFSLTFADYVTR